MRTLKQAAMILLISAFIYTPPTYGANMVNIDTGGIGMAVSDILKPIIKPIAEEFITEAALKLRGALQLLSRSGLCKLNCVTLQKVNCAPLLFKKAGELKVGACKQECQQMIKVGGGYTLKIRYTEPTGKDGGWSLQNCVQTAKTAGVHTFREENRQSIAIYGKPDYDLAMEIIGDIAALDRFILKGGKVDGTKDKSAEEIRKLVVEAKKEVETMNITFQEYAQKNFGPQ